MLQLATLRKRCEHAVVILTFVSSDLPPISDQRYLLVVMQIQ